MQGGVEVEEDRPYYIQESKVPPAGLSLMGEYRRARWYDGRLFVWYCYKVGPLSKLTGSGLVYDQLKPIEPEEEGPIIVDPPVEE